MRLRLHGGFGEKGRLCVGVKTGETRLLLDFGVDPSKRDADRFPLISDHDLAKTHALVITHAHEDHIAGLGHALARGFKGRVLMTDETREAMPAILAEHASREDCARTERCAIETFRPGDALRLGDCVIQIGRSGHTVGCVWLRVAPHVGPSLLHFGDVVPHSPVLAMDAPPQSDIVLFDASYGDDAVPSADRIAALRAWVARAAGPCLLPTPLLGRSLDLLAALDAPVAIHPAMRPALAAQIAATDWLRPQAAPLLRQRLAQAIDWREDMAFPPCPLLTDDAMGLGGPSMRAIPMALEHGVPILLTGHMPAGSPAQIAHAQGRADWIRIPTHPTLPETLELVANCAPHLALGHSCDAATAQRLQQAGAPAMRFALTGETIDRLLPGCSVPAFHENDDARKYRG